MRTPKKGEEKGKLEFYLQFAGYVYTRRTLFDMTPKIRDPLRKCHLTKLAKTNILDLPILE